MKFLQVTFKLNLYVFGCIKIHMDIDIFQKLLNNFNENVLKIGQQIQLVL